MSLDKILEDVTLKRYSQNEIVNRTIVGNGGFGVVYKAQLKHTDVNVALKMLFTNEEQDSCEKLVKELKTHKMVDDHPNVIRCFGLYIGKKNVKYIEFDLYFEIHGLFV
ncbi:5730_t:CDS:2 [Paraglomus occultum]|uniref:5730_t:CDS:1 n=1 Tax=Paraglomus occultum TaxID=144539 RepID=A0A9N9D287_9GLOM|nr:5730_t:CDS:2 [Paraglomus occultum]